MDGINDKVKRALSGDPRYSAVAELVDELTSEDVEFQIVELTPDMLRSATVLDDGSLTFR